MSDPSEISLLTIEQLRPLVQQALEVGEWPGDWPAAGLILERTQYQISKSSFNVCMVTIMSLGAIASGIEKNPVTAIFRAFLGWKTQVDKKK